MRVGWLAREILLCLALLSALSLCGCYAAAVGVVLGATSGSSGGGGKNAPPVVPAIEAPVRIDGDLVRVKYVLLDDDGGPVDVDVSWRPEGGDTFFPATPGPLEARSRSGVVYTSHPTVGLPTPSNGSLDAAFHWRAREDLKKELVGKPVARVQVRIQAREQGIAADPAETAPVSAPFWAGNEAASVQCVEPVTCIEARADTGVIPLRIKIADSSGDPVELSGTFRVGLDGPPRPMTILGLEEGSRLETSTEGIERDIFWDSAADLPGLASEAIHLELLAGDGLDPPGRPERPAGPFRVDNNDDPFVQLIGLAGSADRSFEIPIRFVVQDGEESPVSVVLQWSFGSEPFPELPTSDPSLLRAIVSGLTADARDLRRDLRIATPARVTHRGTVAAAPDLGPDQVRIPDLVRNGFIFIPPTQSGPRGFPPGALDAASGAPIVGRGILFEGPAVQASGRTWATILSVDPATSIVTLDSNVAVSPGTRYEILTNDVPLDLASSRDGLLHSFVWDSRADLLATGAPLDSRVRLRAAAIDSQVGPISPETSSVDLESGPFREIGDLTPNNFPSAMAAGDLNGDSLVDLAVVNGFAGTLNVFIQASDGTFAAAPSQILDTGSNPVSVAVADLDRDGRNDVVVAGNGSDPLRVFLGDPSRRLVPLSADAFPSTTSPVAVAVGDVAGGEEMEIILASESERTVSIHTAFKEEGGLRFEVAPFSQLRLESSPASICLGDVNSDTRLDLIVVRSGLAESDEGVSIFLGRPEGFLPQPDLTALPGRFPGAAAVGDVDGDGDGDLVIVNQLDATASVYLQREAAAGRSLGSGEDIQGRLLPNKVLRTGGTPSFVAIADLDGDGWNDVVITNKNSSTAGIYRQDGESHVLPEVPTQTLETPPLPIALAAGDLNGDGALDLAVACAGAAAVRLFAQQRPGFTLPRESAALAALDIGRSVVIADLNMDGRNDVLVLHRGSDRMSIFFQDASGVLDLTPGEVLSTLEQPLAAAAGDLNGDGRNDIAVAHRAVPSVIAYLQDCSGRLGKQRPCEGPVAPAEGCGEDGTEPWGQTIVTEAPPDAVAIGDVNGDGRSDLVVAVSLAARVVVHLQTPEGRLSCSPIPKLDLERTTPEPNALVLGDLDSDGLDDIAVTERGLGRVNVYHQAAVTGVSSTPTAFLATGLNSIPLALAVGDVDADGRPDLVAGTTSPSQAVFFLQKASRRLGVPAGETFSDPDFRVGATSPTAALALGDLSGDGRVDVAVATPIDPTLKLLIQGPAGFPEVEPRRYTIGRSANSVALGDLNGDGRADIITANGSNSFLPVFLAR
jgi:hypothetical protein